MLSIAVAVLAFVSGCEYRPGPGDRPRDHGPDLVAAAAPSADCCCEDCKCPKCECGSSAPSPEPATPEGKPAAVKIEKAEPVAEPDVIVETNVACVPCVAWKKGELDKLKSLGVTVRVEEVPFDRPLPGFRVKGKDGRYFGFMSAATLKALVDQGRSRPVNRTTAPPAGSSAPAVRPAGSTQAVGRQYRTGGRMLFVPTR